MSETPNANMADHSVGTWGESHESEAGQALLFCFYNASNSLTSSSICSVLFHPPYAFSFCSRMPPHESEIFNSRDRDRFFCFVLFFSVSSFSSEGKPNRRRQETVSDRVLYLAPSCCHLAQCFH